MTRLVDARAVALRVLCRVEQEGAWSNLALSGELGRSRLSSRDRALTTDLVRGTLRWQLALDTLLSQVVNRQLPNLDVPVRQGLRLGAYQLVQMGVAPHAAVSTTVDALEGHRGRGLVNASLRSLSRLGPPWPYPGDPVILAFPEWLREEWAGAPALMAALQRPATTHVRLRKGREAEAESRMPPGAVTGRLVPEVRRFEEGGNPAPLVRDGLVTVQDEAAAAVGMAARPGAATGVVVDLCAGPGGKATQVAELAPRALVLALDSRPSRAGLVARAARRLGLPNLAVAVADARHPPVAPLPAGTVLLLDAPCTGLGTLRRRPEIRHRVTAGDVAQLAALQKELARAAAALIPPGGRLVYSVCTLTRQETLGVAEVLLEELEEEKVQPGGSPHPCLGPGPGGFFLPEEHDTDGMYLLALRRP